MNLLETLHRNLLFIGGKGGVGKTVVSQAIARTFSERGKRTLWATFEDPTRPMGEINQVGPLLWHLNCEPSAAFEEYMGLKIGLPGLTKIFLQNKVMRYLAKASPGIHELVLLGKVWHERKNYEHVVIDMPSTGYGLAMFQSTENFARLFHGGPIYHDAVAMMETFRDPKQTGHLVVSLPEEMPLIESLELRQFLVERFPNNPPAMLVNRRFPAMPSDGMPEELPPHQWENPLATSALDYVRKRATLEAYNLRLWDEQKIQYLELPMMPPSTELNAEASNAHVTRLMSALIKEKSWI